MSRNMRALAGIAALGLIGLIAVVAVATYDEPVITPLVERPEEQPMKPTISPTFRAPSTDNRQALYNEVLSVARKAVADTPDVCTPEALTAFLVILEYKATGAQAAIGMAALSDACLEKGLVGAAVGGASVNFSPYYQR